MKKSIPSINQLSLEVEHLESRLMLDGNVVAFTAGGDLFLTGNSQDNAITITASGSRVLVQGTENTTVNGRTSNFVAFRQNQTPRNIFVSLTSGNNSLGIDGVQIQRDLNVVTGSGVDRIAVRDATIGDDVFFHTSLGADVISFRDVQVGDDAEFFTSNERDFLVFENSTISDDARFFTGLENDTIAMRDSVIGDHAEFFLSSGDDLISLDSTRINDNTLAFLDGGNDVLDITGSSLLRDRLLTFAGTGDDAVQIESPDNLNAGESRFSVERRRHSRAEINSRLNEPGGAFHRADLAQEVFGDSNGNENPNEDVTITVDANINPVLNTNGGFVTDEQTFVVSGQTNPGATVDVSRDGDDVFDDATVVADESGNFSVPVQLQNDGIGNGANTIVARSTLGTDTATSEPINVHFAEGTVVRFETSLGPVDVELLDEATPLTVENFLNYQSRYVNSFVQRSDRAANGGDFIIQGGGFSLDGNTPERIVRDAPVQSEFDPTRSNVRGTLSMALPSGNPNGGTSEWFFNISDDNAFLDAQQFTVFGRVIGDGMDVVDQIHALETFNLNGVGADSALADLPLIGFRPFTDQITGTASVNLSGGDILITGNNTQFNTELTPGQAIRIDGQTFTVRSILTDTDAILDGGLGAAITGASVEIHELPQIDDYIIIDVIDTLAFP